MKRTIALSAVLCLLSAAGAALADDAAQQPGAAAQSQNQTPNTTPPPSTTPAPANQTPSTQTAPSTAPAPAEPAVAPDAGAPAAPSAADVLGRIRDEGKKTDAKTDQKVTTALDAVSNDVEKSVSTDGDQKIAERLAAEFGATPDALLSEKADLKASWGQIMIAHSLIANGTTDLTAKQLFDLRGEGMSWGQIANGMGYRLGDVVKAAKEEARVAKGLAKADGKVAVVHGAGSKAGDATAKTDKAAMKAAAKAEKAQADAAKAQAKEASKQDDAKTAAPASPGSEGGAK